MFLSIEKPAVLFNLSLYSDLYLFSELCDDTIYGGDKKGRYWNVDAETATECMEICKKHHHCQKANFRSGQCRMKPVGSPACQLAVRHTNRHDDEHG